MTGDLDMMVKFRDLQVAEAVGKKAALGWFDVEFTMYGCAYLDPRLGKMCYRVSERAEDIYEFAEDNAHKGVYASNVVHLTRKYPVPSGMKNLIAEDVKKSLAVHLRKQYPSSLFNVLYELSEALRTNTAAPLLEGEMARLEGIFEEEQLNDFLDLANYCHSVCSLLPASYQRCLKWYKDEMMNLADNFVSKDIFETTVYGVGYEAQGRVRYLVNANVEKVYSKIQALEQEGAFVGPVMRRKYWYNYERRLPDVIAAFKACLQEKYPPEKLAQLKAIVRKKGSDQTVVEKILAEASNIGGSLSQETLMRYMNRWGYKQFNNEE